MLQVLYISTKYDWTSGQLLVFKGVTAGVSAAGQFLIFPLLIRLLQVNINIVGLLTVVSRVSHYLVMALGSSDMGWTLYISAVVNCLQGVQVTHLYSLIITINLFTYPFH